MISVIMSTWDRQEKLKEAIKSVVEQSYEDWELIVISDGKQPAAEKIVKAFKDDRVKYQKLPEHFGTDTRPKNVGIAASKGEYIAFLDDDNKYRKDHLSVLLNALEEDDNLDGVYGDRFVYIDGEKQGIGVASDWKPAAIFGQNYIDTSDVLFKRECIFDMGGFDESYRKFIDWNLWVRMAKCLKVLKRVPIIITDYYIDATSKSARAEDTKGPMIPAWHPLECECRLDYLGKKEEPKIAVFSLTYDRKELTRKCFSSMYKTAGYPFDHFVVDNGSEDGTKDYLLKLKNPNGKLALILNDDNKGISIASNQALDLIKEQGPYDIIMKVDNDCLFKQENWLIAMIGVWKVFPSLALSLYVEGLKDNPGGAGRIDYMTINNELIGMTKHLGGICHFVDAGAYKHFRWDEDDFLHGVQDMVMSQNLGLNGYYMGYMESWYCEHCLGTEEQHKKYKKYFDRRVKEKHTKYGKDK